MHWAQGAERAAVVPPRPKFCCYRFGGEISFLAWLSGNYSLRAGKLRLRQTDVPGAECALSHTKLG